MILKASQRSGRGLAAHLLNHRDNDFVEVGQLRGFIATDVAGAFEEIEAISRATRCSQPFLSLSLSPPPSATVLDQDFEDAAKMAMDRLGLAGQPHALIFHEKEGRRHAHLVVSRITPEIRAVNLSFFKEKLNGLARELYLTHGWDMPKGMEDRTLSDPLNFSLEEWQLAVRNDRDPREIKSLLKRLWSRSDGAKSFSAALQERGFALCRGDQRGYVATDYVGNVYSLTRWLDVRTKDLAERLASLPQLPTVGEARKTFADRANSSLSELAEQVAREKEAMIAPLLKAKRHLVAQQRAERARLAAAQEQRRIEQAKARAAQLRKGLVGIFDWVTGRRAKQLRLHRAEAAVLATRDSTELSALRVAQHNERAKVQTQLVLRRTEVRLKSSALRALTVQVNRQANEHHPGRSHDRELDA